MKCGVLCIGNFENARSEIPKRLFCYINNFLLSQVNAQEHIEQMPTLL